LQTSQGYIIRILQHFATKLRNITNFVMLFQAVMKFLSRLVKVKGPLRTRKVLDIQSLGLITWTGPGPVNRAEKCHENLPWAAK
jgi:hypothetical protein